MQQVGGDEVEVKRVQLSIPAGHDLSGLTFVIRSADSTAWWRDGESQTDMSRRQTAQHRPAADCNEDLAICHMPTFRRETIPPCEPESEAPSPILTTMHVAPGGANYSIPVPGASEGLAKENPLAGFEDDLSRTIVDCEVNADQWTLMHRYNKATELIEQALNVRLSHTPACNCHRNEAHATCIAWKVGTVHSRDACV